jgi:hypothetical protein
MGVITSLAAKMTLDTGEWSTNVTKASSELKALQKSVKNADDFIDNFSGGLMKSAAQFAGWAGAGLAAKEGLEKFLRAGQTTSDWMDRKMAGWSGMFDEFFRSLNNGTITGFLSNMGAVRKAIENAVIAADAFADAKASMGVLSLSYDVKQRELLEEIKRNKDNPEVVERVQEELKQLENDRKNNLAGVVGQKQASFEALLNSTMIQPMAAGLRQLGDFSLKRIMELKPTTLSELGKLMEAEALGTFELALGEAKKIAESSVGIRQTRQYDIHGNRILGYEKYDKKILTDQEISSFSDKWGFSIADIIYYAEMVDKLRNELRNSASELYTLKKSQFEFNERNTEIFNMKPSGGGGGGGSKGGKPYGSMAWYDAEMSKLTTKIKEATNLADILKFKSEAEAIGKRKETLEIAIQLGEGIKSAVVGGSITDSVNKINASDISVNRSANYMPLERDLSLWETETDVVGDLQEGLGGVAEMLSTISNLTNDGTKGWIEYASNAINALSRLMVALKAVGIGNAASQSAAAGPFGWLQIPVAVAAVVSAFASAPKFAMGGIVPGNSFSGDRVMSYLNSGEMVLNRNQQARLFGMLNGTASGGGSVQFEIRGDTLVGVLNNYSRRRAKVV